MHKVSALRWYRRPSSLWRTSRPTRSHVDQIVVKSNIEAEFLSDDGVQPRELLSQTTKAVWFR